MSKAATTSGTNGLVPRLRFPEFQRSEAWSVTPLGEMARLIDDRAGSATLTPMSITSGFGLVPQSEKFGREIAGNQYKNYFVLDNNDFAYNKSATKDFPEGFIALYEGERRVAVPNSIFTCFRLVDGTVPRFLNYQLSNNLHGKWLRRFVAVGARAHGSLNVDNRDLLALPVPQPDGPTRTAEEKKIADCLSSLDDVITAHADKLAALKQHKQGLLEQLFPREGETAPRLRFPEFQPTGSWTTSALGDICTIHKGKGILRDDVVVGGRRQCIRYGELYTMYGEIIHGTASATNLPDDQLFLSESGDVIVPASGETKEDIATASCVTNGGVALGGDLNVIRSPLDGPFFAYYVRGILKTQIARVAQGDSVVHLYPSQLSKVTISYPSKPEQQRIAACLSTLDTLITAESDQLAALKQHKQGLLQQLFPVMAAA